MKKEERIEGNAFTRSSTIVLRTETEDELLEGLRELVRHSSDPWDSWRPLVGEIRSKLAELVERDGGRWNFEPHDEPGWYLSQLEISATMIEADIANGNASRAATNGVAFGRLWSEFQLSVEKGPFFCKATTIRDAQAAAGKRSRKGGYQTEEAATAVRVAKYREYRADGYNKSDATDLAAEKLGVSAATIRRARKCASASD